MNLYYAFELLLADTDFELPFRFACIAANGAVAGGQYFGEKKTTTTAQPGPAGFPIAD